MSDFLSLNTGDLADAPQSTLHGLLGIAVGEPAQGLEDRTAQEVVGEEREEGVDREAISDLS